MKKDIYIIKNKINNKVYIGQTVNPEQRWNQYKTEVKKRRGSQVIIKAMIKYGINNFTMEIIEPQIENYDEREQYWIKYYNSIVPNGYNIAPGGQGTGSGIKAYGAKIKTEEKLKNIIDDIIVSNIPLIELAKKYNISYGMINEINQGHTYRVEGLEYPLRDSLKYSEEKLKQITYSLKYELDKTLTYISKEYDIDKSFLNDINQGKSYYREYLTYPLRKGKMKQAEEDYPIIKNLLINSTLSQKEIAKQFNRSQITISEINLGKKGYDKNLIYPLRNNEERIHTCISPDLLHVIEQEIIASQLSFAAIGKKYGIPSATITKINSGKIKKYFNPTYKYPLRKK